MFEIKPIFERNKQLEIADMIGAQYFPDSIAYYAAELGEDYSEISEYFGLCQFKTGEKAVFVSFDIKDDHKNDEAVVILCRTVMSFLSRAGSKTLFIPDDICDPAIMKSFGLPRVEGGCEVDLIEFYKSPCKYNERHTSDV